MFDTGTSSNHLSRSILFMQVSILLFLVHATIGCQSSRPNEPGTGELSEFAQSDNPTAQKNRPASSRSTQERFLGRVTAVHEAGKFVVVRSSAGRLNLPSGSPLEARGIDGVRTRLTLSPEQKPSFLCADYLDTPPNVGDFVFQVPPPEEMSFDDAEEFALPPQL